MKNRVGIGAALALLLSACGGEGGNEQKPAQPPEQPQLSEAQRVSQALASHSPLPLFPITPPTVEEPLLDGNGVILDKRNNSYNPAVIARFALERYSRWRTNEPQNGEDWIDTARRQTDWLAANIDCKEGLGVWRYPFPASFGAEPGWTSGFANAHAIVALLIMSRFIQDPERYIEPALCAVRPFEVDVERGGFVTSDLAGPWFEEYATPMRSGVLNGHIFALAGLHYTCINANYQRACNLFHQGSAALKGRLPRYDTGFTTKYSLIDNNFASPGYNLLQADLLDWLHSVTPDTTFQHYAALFRDYDAESALITASSTVDPIGHGIEHLNNGYLWYGYWSAYVSAIIDIHMGQNMPVRALIVAFPAEPLPFEYAIVADDGSVGPYTAAPTPQQSAYTLAEFYTVVGVYQIGVNARRIRLRFSTPIPGTKVIALREINVLH